MNNRHGWFCVSFAFAALSGPACAQAQAVQSASTTATDAPAGLEEITVTARKTSENLQKAPASIVAVSGPELESLAITDSQQLEKVLPSANLRQEGPVVELFIRGIGGRVDLPNLAPAVAYVYNGIVVPRYGTDGLMFDLGSVQQIAGPQGTLYGGTAAGGAINLNTAVPTNDYSGSGFIEGGNYSEGHIAVAQNVGLGEALSLRGAIDYDRHSGYESNGIDGLNRLSGRLSALLTPSADFSALFFISGTRSDGSGLSSGNPNPPGNPGAFQQPPVGPLGAPVSSIFVPTDDRTDIVGANIQWHAPGGNVFTFIPGYVKVNDRFNFFTGNYGIITDHDAENQTSEELRWNNTFGAFNLSAGIFNQHNKTEFGYSIDLGFAPPPQYYAVIPLNQTAQVNRNSAVYAQGIYSATDTLRFTVGVRGSYDKITATGLGSVGNAYLPFDYDHSHTRPDWKVGVDFDLAPQVLVYANIQTGYIPFGYNPEPGTAAEITVPESKLLAYSAGVKSRFVDNHLELNSEVFYYDYKDFQAVAFVTQTGLSTVLNSKKSTIYGDETTLRALLPYDTEFDTGVTLQNARHNEFEGVGYNYNGLQMASAPFANLLAGAQHTFKTAGYGEFLLRAATHFESGHWGDYTHGPGDHQPAYVKSDVLLTYTPPNSSWNIQAFVRNLENREVFGSLSPGAAPGDRGDGNVEPPRTFGLRVSAKWN